MPANEASQPKSLKVSKPITRALNQLQSIVDAFNDAAGGSMLKILNDLCKPSAHRRH
jgi:hypothetical protein